MYEVSGVENIGQCGRLSQLSWLFAHFNIVTYLLLTYLVSYGIDCGFKMLKLEVIRRESECLTISVASLRFIGIHQMV